MSDEKRTVVCRACGHRDGTHDTDCRAVRRAAKERLQAECDHRPEYGVTQTTGSPLGPPCCGRCGLELSKVDRNVIYDAKQITDQRAAWDVFEACCNGLLARQCKHHAPYMGCPLDCTDVENAIGAEWEAARPVVNALIEEVERLRAVHALAERLANAWSDTSGSFSSVDAINDACREIAKAVSDLRARLSLQMDSSNG